MGFFEASSSFFLAHSPLFTTSFSGTEDVSIFPHEYPEVCLGRYLGLVQTRGRTHLGSIFMPVAMVYKGCGSQFLLQVTHHLPVQRRVLCRYL